MCLDAVSLTALLRSLPTGVFASSQSLSTAGLPLARPGSPSPEVPPLLLAVLQLLPAAGLTPHRILRPDQEDRPGTAADKQRVFPNC